MDNTPPPLQAPDQMYEAPQPPMQPVVPPKKFKKGLLVGLPVIVVLAAAAAGGWYFIQNQTQEDTATIESSNTQTTTTETKKSGTVYFAETDTTGMTYIYQHNLATQTTVELTKFQYAQYENELVADNSFYSNDSFSIEDLSLSAAGDTFLYTTFEGLYEFDIANQKTTPITTWKRDFTKGKFAEFADMPDFVSSGLFGPFYTDDPNVIGVGVGMYEGGYYATFNRTTKKITALPGADIPYGPNDPNPSSTYEIGTSAELFKKMRRFPSAIIRNGILYPQNFNDDASLVYAQSDDAFTSPTDLTSTGQHNLLAIHTTTGASDILATYSDISFSDLIVSGETVIGMQINNTGPCTLHVLNRQQKSFDKKACTDIASTEAAYAKQGDQLLILGNGQSESDSYTSWIVDPNDYSLIAEFKTPAKRTFTVIGIRD